MVSRQMTEEHELKKEHIKQQSELLRQLMETAQNLQLKDMEARQERYAVIDNYSNPVIPS